MNIDKLLSTTISYQDHFWTEIKNITIKEALEEIRGNKHYNYTNYLREFYFKGDKTNYGINKRKLPVVTFCGTYKQERSKEFIDNYNFLVVLDIDKLGTSELLRIKESLLKDDYVFSFWESPSKDGIKGLIHLDYSFSIEKYGIDISHKIAFRQLVNYFNEKHSTNLDISGSDITRLCFLSWDSKIVIKNDFNSFHVAETPNLITQKKKTSSLKNKTLKLASSKDLLNNPFGKNSQSNRKAIKIITKYLSINSLSITNSYADWLRVAFAISNTFTFNIGKKYFVELCKLDSEKFNEIECKNLLINCYENTRGEIGFNTIIHLAVEKGFKLKNTNVESN